jgi:hypothetical protein
MKFKAVFALRLDVVAAPIFFRPIRALIFGLQFSISLTGFGVLGSSHAKRFVPTNLSTVKCFFDWLVTLTQIFAEAV